MTRKVPNNLSDSIRARLLNLARERKSMQSVGTPPSAR